MTNVKHFHDAVFFVEFVDDSVNVGLTPEEKMTVTLAFGRDCTAFGEAVETVNRLSEAIEPFECRL